MSGEIGRPPHTVVIGAGVAGLVAAYELSARGLDVTVLEAASEPGGRTTSWTDTAGYERDTGPHLLVDHYVNLLEVLREIGVCDQIVWMRRPLYLRRDASAMEWRLRRAPAPLHLLTPARMIGPRLLPRVGRAGLEMLTLPEQRLSAFDDRSYADWQRGVVGDRLADLADAASEVACFLPAAEASAYVVLSWLRTLMRGPTASHVAGWRAPFQEAFVGPLVGAIERRGGSVRTSTAVTALELADGGIRSVSTRPTRCEGAFHRADGIAPLAPGGEARVPCDFVISALPPPAFGALFGNGLARAAGVESALRLGTVPALSVTLWLDRPVGPAPDCPPICDSSSLRGFVDWASLRRRRADQPAVVQFVLTEPQRYSELSDAAVIEAVWAEYLALWPPAREAVVVDRLVERIGAAMVACVPGAYGLRPGARTRLDNLFLAGDWTRHDVKPTMEGAAISGRHAANGVLEATGRASVNVLTPPAGRFFELARRARARRPLGLRAAPDPARPASTTPSSPGHA